MKYYVVSDIHGFYSELMKTLKGKGFFEEKEEHKLIICGDIFDRGQEAKLLQDFVQSLMEKDEVILIRGNHEDLMIELLAEWESGGYLMSHHISNGTVNTVCQLVDESEKNIFFNAEKIKQKMMATPYIKKIIPAMLDYYETKHYIFVHGWIPCVVVRRSRYIMDYYKMKNWRKATKDDWGFARWTNGIDAANFGVTVSNKKIVCGHWHCSYGHMRYENGNGEFDDNADFSPYISKGIIAIDACTAFSKKINCIVIED